MRKQLSHLLKITAFAVLVGAVGCGYTTGSMTRVSSVYVPVFDNVTYRRGYEVDLTRAVVDEIKRFTDLDIVPREEAESVLEGTITNVEERVDIKTVGDVIVQRDVTLTVRMRWKDPLTNRDFVSPQQIEETVDFAPALGESFGERAFKEMAERIVEKTWGSW